MSSDISWTYFRALPRNNPLSIVMGARIILSGMLDKLYVEAAGSMPASFIIRGLGTSLVIREIAEEEVLEDKNCSLLGERDTTQ